MKTSHIIIIVVLIILAAAGYFGQRLFFPKYAGEGVDASGIRFRFNGASMYITSSTSGAKDGYTLDFVPAIAPDMPKVSISKNGKTKVVSALHQGYISL